MNKHKIAFILNPKAGPKKNKTLKQSILKYLDSSKFDNWFFYTSYAGEATKIAMNCKEEGYFAVVAVGGDGTVNEVAQSLVHSNTLLGVIPRGSGNGLARVLKIPLTIKGAIETINHSNAKTIDTGKANNDFFVNNCGVGVDTFIAQQIKGASKRGFNMYAKQTTKAVLNYLPQTYLIQTETSSLQVSALLLSIANGHEFGFGFKIAPTASIDDGWLDCVILEPFKVYTALKIFTAMRWGNLLKNKKVSLLTAKHFTISSEALNSFQVDGDVKECNGSVTVSINPLSLKVIVP